ncbi:MAG: hypothetical protein ABIA37_04350 [Candidatus Woesearchaeota archaeon]
MIGWYLGILGILIGVAGCFFFLKSVFHLEGELKKSLVYLVIAASIYIVFSSLMIVFGVMRYEITDPWWQAIPVLFLVSTIFFVVGASKLVKVLQSFSGRKKVKK